MRDFVKKHIDWCADVDAALEHYSGSDIGTEGIARQIGGAIKDTVVLKELRQAFKITGWTGWSTKRMLKGIDAVEDAMNNFIDSYIAEFDLKGKKVPDSALDSWIAWDDNRTSSIYLLDNKRFKDVLTAAESGPTWKIFTDSIKTEIHILFGANEVRDIISDRIKKFEDFKSVYQNACANARKLVEIAGEDSWAKIPRTILAGHYVGINGLVVLGSQFRSSIRRAI